MNKHICMMLLSVLLLLAACNNSANSSDMSETLAREEENNVQIDSSNYVPMKTTKEEDKAIRDYWINVVGIDDIYEFAGEDPADQEKYLGMAFQLMYKELNCHGYRGPTMNWPTGE